MFMERWIHVKLLDLSRLGISQTITARVLIDLYIV